jgi:uncharacterized protein YjbI with pentapeptide repeats
VSRANLRQAELGEACFSGANLLGCDLSAANLTGTDLSGAILLGANLEEAILIGANLAKALVSAEHLGKAARLHGATLPDGARYDGSDSANL